jgi:hypothetical protein
MTVLMKIPHFWEIMLCGLHVGRGQLKCDGTRAETRFRLSAKRTSPFKSAGASVQSTTGSRGVRISGSNAGYTVLRGSVKGSGYPFHSPDSPSLSLPCVTMCHHISTGVYQSFVGACCLHLEIGPKKGSCSSFLEYSENGGSRLLPKRSNVDTYRHDYTFRKTRTLRG